MLFTNGPRYKKKTSERCAQEQACRRTQRPGCMHKSSTTLFRSVHGSGKATWRGEILSSVDSTGHVGTNLLRPTNDIPAPPRTVRFTDKRNLCQNTSFLSFPETLSKYMSARTRSDSTVPGSSTLVWTRSIFDSSRLTRH